ncbi:MAG: flagellar hook-length control protein FliK [Arcobacteraceae bacterium]|nr:flagellar hook-length control protein FliK [Arcobacteraceae bacterium]
MNVNTSTLLNILAPKLKGETKSTIENLSKDGKVDITSLLKDTNIKTLLNSLFKDLASGIKTKESVNRLLQNSKQMFDFKSLSSDVKEILKHIQTDPKLEKQTAVLKQFQLDVKNLDEKVLKSNISNSGVFLESKLVNNKFTISKVQNDIKAVLLQVQEQLDSKGADIPKEVKAQVEKVLSQIEFYQLTSLASQSNHTYLPFSQGYIEDADIKFNSSSKDTFSCHISLALKDHGDIKVMLLLDNKNNLNINISVQQQDFKSKLQENLQLLRQGINKIGLSLQSLNVLDIQDPLEQTYEQKAYNSSDNLSFGIDLKA